MNQTLTIPEAIERARRLAKGGDPRGAMELYSMVLASDPRNKKAKKELKALEKRLAASPANSAAAAPATPSREEYDRLIALVSGGRAAEARRTLGELITRFPNDPFLHNLAGVLHAQGGEPAAAVECYRRALALNPRYAEALGNLGSALKDSGRLEEALEHYHQALAIDPRYATAHYNLGDTYDRLGRPDAAIDHYRQALALKPDYVKALNNLGSSLKGRGELEEARDCYLRALELAPGQADLHYNLGVVLCELDRLEEAAGRFEQALALNPMHSEAHANLANTLRHLGRPFEQAERHFLQALELDGSRAKVHTNFGDLYLAHGRREQALACYRRALSLNADDAETHFSLALCLLLMGEFEQGWKEYEWRLHKHHVNTRALDYMPRWEGDFDFDGELILVHEQGLGDTLQFMRYGIELKRHLPRVSLAVPPKLVALAEQSGIFDRVYPTPLERGSHDADARWCPMLSVAGTLGVNFDQPLVLPPYLKPPAELEKRWRERLRQSGEFIVGINWQGNPDTEKTNLKGRSLSLADLRPLAEVAGVRLVSLQKGHGAEQLAQCGFRDRFVDCQAEVDEAWDFLESAAIVKGCDLVISSDTMTAHLAGGLGAPTWTLLHTLPDWRWGLEREDTPWYPAMRLFRQRRNGDWAEVVERVAQALAERMAPRGEN